MFPSDPCATACPCVAAARSENGTLEVRTIVSEGSRACLRLTGELDLATADTLSGVLDQELASGRRTIYVDVSGLNFIDCSGLRVLVHAHNGCLARRGGLVLSHVGPPIARLLDWTGLSEALFVSDEVPATSHRATSRRRAT